MGSIGHYTPDNALKYPTYDPFNLGKLDSAHCASPCKIDIIDG